MTTPKTPRKSYGDMLKDPRWQKRRLEVLGDCLFTCRRCSTGTKEMHVHHLIYRKGVAPWEYNDDELIALCDDCHMIVEDAITRMNEAVLRHNVQRSDPECVYDEIAGYIEATKSSDTPSERTASYMRGFTIRRLWYQAWDAVRNVWTTQDAEWKRKAGE